MGKKKKNKKLKIERINALKTISTDALAKLKPECCKKYKKSEKKRCKKCPCFDLMKKVA